jgi:YEATS domain-containing protein 4
VAPVSLKKRETKDRGPKARHQATHSSQPFFFSFQDGTTRVKDTEFVFPIVIGTVAISLGKKATETETHKWTLYVRSADNTDLTDVVAKVVFHLHPTFHNPDRELAAPPYELTETGWGEFEVSADVHFVATAGAPPVELVHRLRLYSDADPTGASRKPVVSETYDEVVFTEPRLEFWDAVKQRARPPAATTAASAHFLTHSPDAEYKRIGAARQRVAQVKAAVIKQLAGLGAGGASADGGGGGDAAGVPSFAAATAGVAGL